MNPQIMNLLNNPKLLQQKYNEVKQLLAQNGITPQQALQNLLNSGKMKQSDYDILRGVVNNFAGTNY